jgi:hypothetical protein
MDESSGLLIPTIIYGGVSNHIVAYIRSLSGPAVEKPPQDNQIIQADAFGYRVLCVNAPTVPNTLILNGWLPQGYPQSSVVFSDWKYWVASANTGPGDVPGQSAKWGFQKDYSLNTTPNLHELRLTFLWPQQPNGKVGPGRQTFRTMVAGQVTQIVTNGQSLYYYQPQSFGNTP